MVTDEKLDGRTQAARQAKEQSERIEALAADVKDLRLALHIAVNILDRAAFMLPADAQKLEQILGRAKRG